MAMHALGEAMLLQGDYSQAMDTAEEALQISGDDLLEATVTCAERCGLLGATQGGLLLR